MKAHTSGDIGPATGAELRPARQQRAIDDGVATAGTAAPASAAAATAAAIGAGAGRRGRERGGRRAVVSGVEAAGVLRQGGEQLRRQDREAPVLRLG